MERPTDNAFYHEDEDCLDWMRRRDSSTVDLKSIRGSESGCFKDLVAGFAAYRVEVREDARSTDAQMRTILQKPGIGIPQHQSVRLVEGSPHPLTNDTHANKHSPRLH